MMREHRVYLMALSKKKVYIKKLFLGALDKLLTQVKQGYILKPYLAALRRIHGLFAEMPRLEIAIAQVIWWYGPRMIFS